jgi:subtilase family serine protease
MRIVKYLLPALLLVTLFSNLSYAVSPDRIASTIDSSRAVPLARSLHPKARIEFDRGAVDPAFKLNYMTLVTTPSAAQQRALNQLLAAQQDPASASYHQWLTPSQYADRFGLSQNDIGQITDWLNSQGFAVLSVGGGRNSVAFSGTAEQVKRAFGSEIHRYEVDGESHIANSTPVMIPAALGGVVNGIRGLHDFRMQPANRSRFARLQRDRSHPNFVDLNYIFPNFLAPADVATIYDINPLYNAATPINGSGQKIAVVGQADIFLADINDFRSGFGLTPISGCTLTTTGAVGLITACNTSNFQYVLLGTDPLLPGQDIGEADLDVEWSGAVAPNAQIIYVNSETNNGVDDALAAAINPPSGPPLAPVISMSYGICEAFSGDQETELTQANAEGVTIMVSSGDVGAASCDRNPPGGSNATPPFSPAIDGLAVSYPASSPEVTAVGGTAISTANDSNPPPAQYWAASNGTNGGTALKYIPELAWNDNEELGNYCAANPSIGFCNPGPPGVVITSAQTFQEDYWISSGGGGASNCWTESNTGVCQAGFPQPTWQQGLTVPLAPANVRYVPDVSLFASANLPGYIFCTPQNPFPQSGTPVYTSTCSVSIFDAVDRFGSLVGGTSVSTPVFAGIVALMNQYLAGPSSPGLGNINPALYSLAKTSSNNAFHRGITGDNYVYCQPGQPSNQTVIPSIKCPTTGTAIVGFSAANADATTGYNLVTGLGSVDANNLALAWGSSRSVTTISITPSVSQINVGQSVTFTATISSTSVLGNVSFFDNGSATALGSVALTAANNGVAMFSTTTLPAGANHVTATYNGDVKNRPSTTAIAATVTVTTPDFTIAVVPTGTTVAAGHNAPTSGNITVTLTPINGYSALTTFSCTGLPTGATCAFNPNGTSAVSTTMTMTTAASMATGAAPFTISATGSGVTHTANFTLTTTATDQSFTLAPQNANYSVTRPQSVNATLTLTPTNGFNTAVTYTCTDAVSETTCTGPSGPTSTTSPAFVITTTAPTRAMVAPFGRGKGIFYAALLPGMLGIMFTVGSRKRSLRGMRLLGLIAVLGFSTLWLGSCGGSNSGTHDLGTPTGKQSVTVNATTGGANPVTASTTITFTVN